MADLKIMRPKKKGIVEKCGLCDVRLKSFLSNESSMEVFFNLHFKIF